MREITIHYLPADDNNPVRVRVGYRSREGAQTQERETAFQFSFTREERGLIQWYLEEYLMFPWASHRARQAEALMSQKGQELFEATFGGVETSRLFANVVNDLPNTRIVVHASDPEGIALPWELMRDPQREPYGDLARLAYAFVRSQPDLFFDVPQVVAESTFNILLVISRPGGPGVDVPFQSVARPLLERCAFHEDKVRIDVLRPPTFERLSRVLSERPNFYHVLHFDGHGGFPLDRFGGDTAHLYADASVQGRLLFEQEDGTGHPVTGEELGNLLAGKKIPMVVLNACQSGMSHSEALYQSVGNQLLKAGVGGVVAMAYSVYVQSAVCFVTRLYEGLINGEDLARAVALGREGLRVQSLRSSPIGDIALQDWMVPVLLEAYPIRLTDRPAQPLHFRLTVLQDGRARAGAEVNCPEPPAFGFIGRDSIVFTLERAFRRETVVLLQGMAGVGKTEAAVGFARWWAQTGALSGPILFCSFESRLTLAYVCDQVGQAFGEAIRQQLGRDWHLLEVNERRHVALSVLRQVPCLLVWDNFEPVTGFPTGTPSDWTQGEQEGLRQFLVNLRGGATKVLITSRRDEPWLGGIYRRVEIGGMALREAQELAVKVLERAGIDPPQLKSLPDYNALLQYLDGSPLAIQVILPELKGKRPDDLLRDLQAGEANLEADDPMLGRTRSLASSLTYRLERLNPKLRQRLGLLGLFQGFAGLDMLVNISAQQGAPEMLRRLGREEWATDLDAAVEMGLLRALGGGYYRVHPALPWFFHETLHKEFGNELDWLEGVYTQVYAGYADFLTKTLRTDGVLALNLFGVEVGNLEHALRLAYSLGQWKEAASILMGLGQFLTRQERRAEIESLINEGEGQVLDHGGHPLPGREEIWLVFLQCQEKLAGRRRDLESQKNVLLRLKEYYERVGVEEETASTLNQLGIIALQQHQFDEAEDLCRKSLMMGERLGDEYGQASTLHVLGMIAQERRQFDEAEVCYLKSLAINERLKDDYNQGSTLHQLGVTAEERRQFNEAEGWHLKSLTIKERLRDYYGQAQTLHQLGRIAQEQRLFVKAEEWCRRSLRIKEQLKDEHGQYLTLSLLGRIAQECRRFTEAADWYHKSLAIVERLKDGHGQAQTLHQLGVVAQERRELQEAKEWYYKSLAIKEQLKDEYGQAGTFHQLGTVAEECRDFKEAADWYHKSLAIVERLEDGHGQAQTLHQLGRVAEEQGDLREAVGLYERAEALLDPLNDSYLLQTVRASLQIVRPQ